MLSRLWQEFEYQIDVCRVVHISNTSSCQIKKRFQFSFGCEQFHYGRSFGFLVINVCNHGDHYETPYIYIYIYIYSIDYLV